MGHRIGRLGHTDISPDARRIRTARGHYDNPLTRAISTILAVPALRAFWPTSSVDYSSGSRCRDIAGNGYHLTPTNTIQFSYSGLAPYASFGGTNEYLSHADGGAANAFDITGTEGYVPSGIRGLTIAGWFYFDDAAPPAATEYLISKRSATAGNYSYWLERETGNGYGVFAISDDGTNTSTVSTNTVLQQSTWYFLAGRFDPSATVDICVNGNWVSAATARASCYDGTADLCIGSRSGGGGYLDGKGSMWFISAADVASDIIDSVYDQTRTLFGV